MRRLRPLLSAALLALLPLATPAPAAAQAGETSRAEESELAAHVRWLAADVLAGRRAGTPGAVQAARYVADRFRETGLEPAPDHPSYLQAFEFPVGVELGPENWMVLRRDDPDEGEASAMLFTAGPDFLPLAGSARERVVEPVVFVGYGISAPTIGYDDYADVDVDGRIVLALRFSPEGDDPGGRFGRWMSERHKAATAAAKGARAILFVRGPATERIDRPIRFDPAERPGALGIAAASVTQRVARLIVSAGGEDLDGLQRAIDLTGRPHSRLLEDVEVGLEVDIRSRTETTHNVIGMVRGTDPARSHEVVVIGAHYDGLGRGGPGSLDPVPGEIHNGADDNASGVAALLELAEYFARPGNRPDRTLLFVSFGAEEDGMYGSARFVADPPVSLDSVVAMVNMDMIGRMRDELIVHGADSSTSWEPMLEEISALTGVPTRVVPDSRGSSDHAAFARRRIPVLSFFTGVHPDYHRSTDDFEGVDLAGLERVTGYVGRVVARLAEEPGRPTFDLRKPPMPPRRVAAERERRGIRLGAVPAPTSSGEGGAGIVVEAVIPGSPAEAAGMAPGDRVVEVAGRAIASIYDYVAALEEHPVDRPLQLTVVRREGPRSLLVHPRRDE
ncbi:MAG: M20/M25/M40 family metallo-hydrolase [Gemmatimonadota bacterium]|nr:M20/M25/M40 family metallo-hydrolase [Gemmatimonadota bacterium]